MTEPRQDAVWYRGEKHDIKWSKAHLRESGWGGVRVTISLWSERSGAQERVLVPNAPNSGSARWEVPDDVADGTYQVEVKAIGLDGKSFKSKTFKIQGKVKATL